MQQKKTDKGDKQEPGIHLNNIRIKLNGNMSIQIGVLKENETARERKENTARQHYQKFYRENQNSKRLYVQERALTGVSKN